MTTSEGIASRLRKSVSLWGNVAVYLGWAWLFWGLVVRSGESVWSYPNVPSFYPGSVSPVLGGITMIRRSEGMAGLRELWDRISDPRRIRPHWYVVIFCCTPASRSSLAGSPC
jgi:hypothetical protein